MFPEHMADSRHLSDGCPQFPVLVDSKFKRLIFAGPLAFVQLHLLSEFWRTTCSTSDIILTLTRGS